jgi:hypothetical protein
MLTLINKIIARFKILRTRLLLENRIGRGIKIVNLEVVPGVLTLTSYNPDKKQTFTFNGIQHEVYNSIWEGEAYFPFWQGKIDVSLMGDMRPSVNQLAMLQSILNYKNTIRSEIEQELLQYYQTTIYDPIETRKQIEEIFHVSLPKINTFKELQKIIYDPRLYLNNNEENDTVSFKLHFGCLWDEEHGVTVEINDWKLIDTGI